MHEGGGLPLIRDDSKGSQELLDFVSNLAGDQYLKVEEHLGDGYFRINISEAERRQAKHDIRWIEDIVIELARNARDADSSKIFVSSHKIEDKIREIVIIDDGNGIPANLHQKVFEPRVTSKLDNVVLDKYGIHGRGMALFSISSAAMVAYIVSSSPEKGSVFKVKVDATELPERKDQSTLPTIGFRQGEPVLLRGPHNVIWYLSEFSHLHSEIDVYYGSPAEIASTIFHLSCREETKAIKDSSEHSIWQYLGTASGARELVEIARDHLGLEISERNAYRIIQSEIKPVPTLKKQLGLEDKTTDAEKKSGSKTKTTGVSRYFGPEDFARLSRSTSVCAAEIARKYFLHLSGEPKIIKSGNRIKIILSLAPDEEV